MKEIKCYCGHTTTCDCSPLEKQTAVEWLVNELKKSKHYQQMINEVHQNSTVAINVIEQAKAMEKEQIMEAVNIGFEEGSKFPEDIKLNNAEQYYNETYGGKK